MAEFKHLLPNDVHIELGRFEDLTEIVDAFAFYYTATSTFGAALTSGKPIYFNDIGLRNYTKEMMFFLSKKCTYEKSVSI